MRKIIGLGVALVAVTLIAGAGALQPVPAHAKVTAGVIVQDNACVALEAAGAATADDASTLLFACTKPADLSTSILMPSSGPGSRAVPNLDIIAAVASQRNGVNDVFDAPADFDACNDTVDPDTGELAVDDVNELVCSLDARDGTIDGKYHLLPSDFAGIDLDGNQLHAHDGQLAVIGFVDDDSTDTAVKTSVGTWQGTTSKIWVCATDGADQDSGVAGTQHDGDCDGVQGGGLEDGAFVAHLQAHGVLNPAAADEPHGPGTVLIAQEGLALPIGFTVVGEPHSLQLQTFETGVQAAGLTADDCPLGGTAADFTAALGRPDKTIMLAHVLDDDGVQVTGAFISLTSSDPKKLFVASALSVTLDLGAFGSAAPDIFCGGTKTGPVTVTVELLDTASLADLFGVSPERDTRADRASADYTVTGLPASITLAAAPATISCDGTASSTVTATVLDSGGSPVESGTEVTFNVSVLGTANPIVAKTGAGGAATSTVIPLATNATGVPVVVTAGSVSNSILVNCGPSAPAAGGTGGQPAGGAGGAAGAPGGGTISGPNTGTGGYLQLEQRRGSSYLPGLLLVILAVASPLIGGAGVALRRVNGSSRA